MYRQYQRASHHFWPACPITCRLLQQTFDHMQFDLGVPLSKNSIASNVLHVNDKSCATTSYVCVREKKKDT